MISRNASPAGVQSREISQRIAQTRETRSLGARIVSKSNCLIFAVTALVLSASIRSVRHALDETASFLQISAFRQTGTEATLVWYQCKLLVEFITFDLHSELSCHRDRCWWMQTN